MSSQLLSMALDDIVKMGSKDRGTRGGRRRFGRGGSRARIAKPYNRDQASASATTWKHDRFENQTTPKKTQAVAATDSSVRVRITNLHYNVSVADLKELFNVIAPVQKVYLAFDQAGRSKGTAEVVFAKKEDAVAAAKRYNNAQLDGQVIKVEVVSKETSRLADRLVLPTSDASASAEKKTTPRIRRGIAGRRGRGRGRGRGRKPVSAESLDAEMDAYMKESDQKSGDAME